jgi:hypothetical protein
VVKTLYFSFLIVAFLLVGCTGETNEKDRKVVESDSTQISVATPLGDGFPPESSWILTMIDTVIESFHIRIICNLEYDKLQNEYQRSLFDEKKYDMLPLLAVVNQCTTAIGVYSGCDSNMHSIVSLNGNSIARTKGIWVRSSKSFFFMLNWEIGFNGLIGFKIESGCPNWLSRCSSEGLKKYVESLDVYDCFYDSESEKIFCPSSRQQATGVIHQVSVNQGCIKREPSVNFATHPESLPDTTYYLQLAKSVLGK